MRNLYFYSFILSLLFSCTTAEEKKTAVLSHKETPVDTSFVKNEVQPVIVKEDSLQPVSITSDKLPEGMNYKGEFESAWKWYDKTGFNFLILSSKVTTKTDEAADESTGQLFGRHYVLKPGNGKAEILWDMYDVQEDCPFDLTSEFIGTEITDLDSNGIRETFLSYKLSCRSDVSPAFMKIIMHEGKKKYALRGRMMVKASYIPDSLYDENREPDLSRISLPEENKDFPADWGRYENTNDFSNAPAPFLEYARQLWKENCVEQF